MSDSPSHGTDGPPAARSSVGTRRLPRTQSARKLEQRIAEVARASVADRGFVTAIDVLVGVGWLQAVHVEGWRRGQVPYLERVATANLNKLGIALRMLRLWAQLTKPSVEPTTWQR